MSRLVRGGEVVDPDATASDRAVARVEKEGMTLPYRPTYEIPALPDDITSLNDDDLMELFVRVGAWCNYINTRAAAAMVDERDAESAHEVAEARSLVANWGGTSKDRVTVAKAERTLDAVVTKARTTFNERYAYRKMVEVLANSAERDHALVSREITRRTSNEGVARRAQRFGT